jgi:ureidoglycolate lyase
MTQLTIEPLTASAFAGYGDVITQAQTGAIGRFAFVNTRPDARVDLIAARPEALSLPLVLTRIERHPYSSQTFLPLGEFAYLVIVSQDDGHGQPDLATLRAFRAENAQGVSFAPTTWHRSVAALDRTGSFATFTCYAGTAEDIVHADIPPVTIAEL